MKIIIKKIHDLTVKAMNSKAYWVGYSIFTLILTLCGVYKIFKDENK